MWIPPGTDSSKLLQPRGAFFFESSSGCSSASIGVGPKGGLAPEFDRAEFGAEGPRRPNSSACFSLRFWTSAVLVAGLMAVRGVTLPSMIAWTASWLRKENDCVQITRTSPIQTVHIP